MPDNWKARRNRSAESYSVAARVNSALPFRLEPAIADKLQLLLDKFREEHLDDDLEAKLLVSREDVDGEAIIRIVTKALTLDQLKAMLAVLETLV